MGWRFQKRIRIAPGVRLNISRSGVSTTLGPRGLSVNHGKKGTYLNAGLPGTGLSTRTRIGKAGAHAAPARVPSDPAHTLAQPLEPVRPTAGRRFRRIVIWTAAVILAVGAILSGGTAP